MTHDDLKKLAEWAAFIVREPSSLIDRSWSSAEWRQSLMALAEGYLSLSTTLAEREAEIATLREMLDNSYTARAELDASIKELEAREAARGEIHKGCKWCGCSTSVAHRISDEVVVACHSCLMLWEPAQFVRRLPAPTPQEKDKT